MNEIKITGKYTVKVHREYLKLLGGDMSLEQIRDGSDLSKISENLNKANDYLITTLCGLTREQIDELDQADYEKIIQQIEELRDPKEQKD